MIEPFVALVVYPTRKDAQARQADNLARIASEQVRALPGFLRRRVLLSEDGDSLVTLTEWSDREAFQQFRQSEFGRAAVRLTAGLDPSPTGCASTPRSTQRSHFEETERMLETIRSAAAAVAVTMLSAGFAAAQTAAAKPAPDPAQVRADIDKAIEALRKDARAGKADIVGKTMALDSTQAAAFWPLYKQYETEVKLLGDERLAIIQDLAEHFDEPRRRQGQGAARPPDGLEDKRVALTKKYKDVMLKALPAKTVARFFQVDSRLNKLVDLTVASEIPLVYWRPAPPWPRRCRLRPRRGSSHWSRRRAASAADRYLWSPGGKRRGRSRVASAERSPATRRFCGSSGSRHAGAGISSTERYFRSGIYSSSREKRRLSISASSRSWGLTVSFFIR